MNLETLASLVGIADGFTDAFGQRVDTPLEARRGMLEALGFPTGFDALLIEPATGATKPVVSGKGLNGIVDVSEYDWAAEDGTVHRERETDEMLLKLLETG